MVPSRVQKQSGQRGPVWSRIACADDEDADRGLFLLVGTCAKQPPERSPLPDVGEILEGQTSLSARRVAPRWAIAEMVIMGFTPDAVGKHEPSIT